MDKKEHTSDVLVQRTRRNFVAMATIAAAAIGAQLAVIKPALAQPNNNGNGNNNNNNRGSCFMRGTAIRTAQGARKVEDLALGDLLPTLFGGTRPIEWIGRYYYRKSDPRQPWAKDLRPVRIARSALGSDTPHVDLYLTRWHALFIDGVLVPVDDLINGTTITIEVADQFDELEFFHVKLATHDVIYAEGAACETLLMVDDSASNFAEYLCRHGMAMTEEISCAPRLSFTSRGRIESRFRSAISPWIDRRHKFDVIRDDLEERGIALSRHAALDTLGRAAGRW